MRQQQITNQKEADIFFYCRGAVGFFDSHVPKLYPEDPPMVYRRNYFNLNDEQVGWYCPILWQMAHLAVGFFQDPQGWGKHPKLTNLVVDLEAWLNRRTAHEKR